MHHVPLYVYVLFLILLKVGVSRCFPRTVRIERLLTMPVLMLVLGVHGFFGLFSSPNAADAFTGACGVAIGLIVGYRHASGWNVVVDRTNRRLSIPGDIMMFVVILAAFAFEFALHYAIESGSVMAADTVLPPLAAGVWALFIGMTTGRNFDLASRYWRMRQGALT